MKKVFTGNLVNLFPTIDPNKILMNFLNYTSIAYHIYWTWFGITSIHKWFVYGNFLFFSQFIIIGLLGWMGSYKRGGCMLKMVIIIMNFFSKVII